MSNKNNTSQLKNFKKFFEANLLDGDDIKDCGGAMLSAEYVYETLEAYIQSQLQELLEHKETFTRPKMYTVVIAEDGTSEQREGTEFIEAIPVKAVEKLLK